MLLHLLYGYGRIFLDVVVVTVFDLLSADFFIKLNPLNRYVEIIIKQINIIPALLKNCLSLFFIKYTIIKIV